MKDVFLQKKKGTCSLEEEAKTQREVVSRLLRRVSLNEVIVQAGKDSLSDKNLTIVRQNGNIALQNKHIAEISFMKCRNLEI